MDKMEQKAFEVYKCRSRLELMSTGEMIKLLHRINPNASQADIARALGCSRTYVSKIFNNI